MIHERTIRLRSIYLWPEGSKLSQPDDMLIFEGLDRNTIGAGDIHWYGGVDMQMAIDSHETRRRQVQQRARRQAQTLQAAHERHGQHRMGAHALVPESGNASGQRRLGYERVLGNRQYNSLGLHLVPRGYEGGLG